MIRATFIGLLATLAVVTTTVQAASLRRYPCLDNSGRPIVCATVTLPRANVTLYFQQRNKIPLTPPYTWVPFDSSFSCMPKNPLTGTGDTVCTLHLSVDPDGTGTQVAVPNKFARIAYCPTPMPDCTGSLQYVDDPTVACAVVPGAPSTGGCPTNIFPTLP